MNFQYIQYFSNYEKLKSAVETFTPNNQILIFKEQLFLSNMEFIFETDLAQLYSVSDSSPSVAHLQWGVTHTKM